jgi:hypothetical protein
MLLRRLAALHIDSGRVLVAMTKPLICRRLVQLLSE